MLKADSNGKENAAIKILKVLLSVKHERELIKEILFKRVYPNKKFNDLLWRVELSGLNKKLNLFWHVQNASVSEQAVGITLLKELAERKLDHQFELEQNKLDKHFSSLQHQSSQNLYDELIFNELSYINQVKSASRKEDSNLMRVDDSVNQFFFFYKLKYACDMLNRKNIFQREYDFSFIEHIVNYVSKHKIHLDVLSQIYLEIFHLLKHNEVDQFHSLKSLIYDHTDDIDVKEVKDMFAYLQNFCVRQINSGNVSFREELFGIYNTLVEREIIIDNGKMYLFDYKNIATVAILLKQFDWVVEFTEKYTGYLAPKYQEGARSYNLARIHFSKGEYRNTLKELLHVNFTDAYYELGSRLLLAKVYYEQDDIPLLETVLGTFKIYINRNKVISSYQKTIYLNFIKYANKLSKAYGDKNRLKALKEEVEPLKKIVDKEWLIQKIEEQL